MTTVQLSAGALLPVKASPGLQVRWRVTVNLGAGMTTCQLGSIRAAGPCVRTGYTTLLTTPVHY